MAGYHCMVQCSFKTDVGHDQGTLIRHSQLYAIPGAETHRVRPLAALQPRQLISACASHLQAATWQQSSRGGNSQYLVLQQG